MKDFEVTVRIRNNRLKERREALGLTQGQLEHAVWPTSASIRNLSAAQHVSGYESLRVNPIHQRSGAWKPSALKIAAFFGVDPEELWPDAVLNVVGNHYSRKVDAMEVLAVGAVRGQQAELGARLERQEVEEAVRDALGKLDGRSRKILRARFGLDGEPQTLDDLADRFGISRERVRQIETKALERLRGRRVGRLSPALRELAPPPQAESALQVSDTSVKVVEKEGTDA